MLFIFVHKSLSKCDVQCDSPLQCLTIMRNQTVGHIRDCFQEAPQEVKGWQETRHTELVTQLHQGMQTKKHEKYLRNK